MAAKDLTRQIVVISAFCFMIIAAMVGSGLFGGTAVEDLQDGALSSEGSYLAPASTAFSIWSVIYVGLFAYTVWQAFPRQRERSRQRAIGWLVAGTMVLNGLWLITAQFLTLPLTVLSIVLLLALLCVTFRTTITNPGRGVVDAVLIDGVTGLHLGWATLATVANTSAWLTTIAPAEAADAAALWGIAVLIVVGVIGVAIAWASGWRVAPGLAMSWGLVWIGVGRLASEPESTPIGITALVVAAVVLLVPLAGTALHRVADVRNAEA